MSASRLGDQSIICEIPTSAAVKSALSAAKHPILNQGTTIVLTEQALVNPGKPHPWPSMMHKDRCIHQQC